jgi:VWFA-related protein
MSALFAAAQQPAPPPHVDQNGTVFTVTTALVQVDAVVSDSKGHNVADLKPDDFEVLVDGKPQRLTHFSYMRLAPESPAAGTAPVPGILPGLPPPPTPQLRPEDVRRTIVLMVDDLGLSFESMAWVRSSLHKFIDTQMQPGDLIAVMRTGSGSGALQQFTADKRILMSRINGLSWNPNGRAGLNVFEALGKLSSQAVAQGGTNPSGNALSYDVNYEIRKHTISMVGTLGAISYAVDALGEMPGRKSIVLFSDGIQVFTPAQGPAMHVPGSTDMLIESPAQEVINALRRLIDRANRAGTVIYTMHAMGLQPVQLDAADRVPLDNSQSYGAREAQATLSNLTQVGAIGGRDYSLNVSQQGLAYLADRTGGLAYENGNDLNYGLSRVLEDQKGYYLLGFNPPEGLFEGKDRERAFHQISVKVKGSALHVRSRSGFFGETDTEAAARVSRTPIEEMRVAMLSPFKSHGVRVRLTALYAETAKKGPQVRNLLYINAHDLTWQPQTDGSAKALLQVLAVATGADDKPLKLVARYYELRIRPGKIEEAKREGVVYSLDVPVPKRGAYQIRVAVRDEASAKVGSATQFVEIPDLKKVRFALASIVLRDAVKDSDVAFAEISPARRQFWPGDEIEYVCHLEQGEQGRNRGAAANLSPLVRIVRDGKEVYSAPAKIVDVAGSGPAIFGALRLAKAMPPGDYYLQVVAQEPAGGKDAIAGQWTDFRVVGP